MLATHGLLGIIRAVVDSGATTSAVGEDLSALMTEVTEANPNRKLWIADNKGLDIIAIGKASLAVKGFKNGQPNVLFTDELPISRLLVVRGMAKGQILLSVRGMKKDNTYTYLNDDNSLGRSDCLRLHNGTVVPFHSSDHAYDLSVREFAGVGQETPSFPRSGRSQSSIHCSLGHAGMRRINDSNVSIDGKAVQISEHREDSCTGCRLGNTVAGREDRPGAGDP